MKEKKGVGGERGGKRPKKKNTHNTHTSKRSTHLPPQHQNLQNFRWEEADVNRRLDRAMTDAFAPIWAIAADKRVPLRTAAFVQALQRVTRAHIHRGFD